jgi:hypothetical protein
LRLLEGQIFVVVLLNEGGEYLVGGEEKGGCAVGAVGVEGGDDGSGRYGGTGWS